MNNKIFEKNISNEAHVWKESKNILSKKFGFRLCQINRNI